MGQSDKIPIDVIIESLKHHKKKGTKEISPWRREGSKIDGEYVYYDEWNLPPIPTKLLEEAGLDE